MSIEKTNILKQTDFSEENKLALELLNKCIKDGYAIRIDDITLTEYPKERVISLRPTQTRIDTLKEVEEWVKKEKVVAIREKDWDSETSKEDIVARPYVDLLTYIQSLLDKEK